MGKHNRPAKKKGIKNKNKHAQPKDYVPAHTVKQAIMLMRPYMNKDMYNMLLTNAAQARKRPTAYTLLSHAQYKKWKTPCLHHRRVKSATVITTTHKRRTHVIAGPCGPPSTRV